MNCVRMKTGLKVGLTFVLELKSQVGFWQILLYITKIKPDFITAQQFSFKALPDSVSVNL